MLSPASGIIFAKIATTRRRTGRRKMRRHKTVIKAMSMMKRVFQRTQMRIVKEQCRIKIILKRSKIY